MDAMWLWQGLYDHHVVRRMSEMVREGGEYAMVSMQNKCLI